MHGYLKTRIVRRRRDCRTKLCSQGWRIPGCLHRIPDIGEDVVNEDLREGTLIPIPARPEFRAFERGIVAAKSHQNTRLPFPDEDHASFEYVRPLHRTASRLLEIPLRLARRRRIELHDPIVGVVIRHVPSACIERQALGRPVRKCALSIVAETQRAALYDRETPRLIRRVVRPQPILRPVRITTDDASIRI